MLFGLIDFLFLLPIFIIGSITAWEDYSSGKIRNKWLIGALFYGLILCLVLSLSLAINFSYLYKVLLNSLISLLISFGFWRSGLMAAGDAKLFFVFTWFLPLKYYSQSYLPFFPAFALLINIYLPVFAILLSKAIYKMIRQLLNWLKHGRPLDYKKINKKLNKYSTQFLGQLIVFIPLMIIIIKFRDLLSLWIPSLAENNVFLFLFFYFFRRYISSILKEKKLLVPLILSVVLLQLYNVIDIGLADTLNGLLEILELAVIFMVAISILGSIMNNYINRFTTKKIKVSDLKPGMQLRFRNDRLAQAVKKTNGLTGKQISMIKEIFKNEKLNEIKYYQKFAFAPWMLLGIVITIIFKGSIFHYILNLLGI